MKCIILCGGYAKRLWPLTESLPKPLLDINGKTVLDIILEKVGSVKEINEIIISTNTKFESVFRDWMKIHGKSNMKLVIEPTVEEGSKFGTIAGIQFIIESEKIDEDCLIIAGDNLFDYTIEDFLEYYREKATPILAVFDINNIVKASLYGIVMLNENKRIIDFVEKPANPKSTLAATCCYLFPEKVLKMVKTYINEGNRKDSPGYFINWLSKRECVHAFVFKGHWFDIGDLESLEKARTFMKREL